MSISSESTDGGGITTDHHDQQENLEPTNLEPFEEMRLLLARIAELDRQMNSPTSSGVELVAQNENEKRRLLARLEQLEGQQTMNLQTSSEGFELFYDVNHVSLLATGLCLAKEELHQTNEKLKNTEASFDKKFEEQMEEVKRVAKLELENKELRAEHEELSTAHKNLKEELKEQQKMDALKQQKETNDKIDSLKKDQQEQFANMVRRMEQKQKDGQEELERKMDDSVKSVQAMVVAELEKCQNEQQQTIDALTEKLTGSIDQLSLKNQELSNVHKKLMEEIKEQREMDGLKQQKDQKETNDKIGSLIKDQEQCASNIRGMEQKQKNGHEELQRKMGESLKSVQTMVVAELEQQKLSNANKFAELEVHQKQNIDALKRNGLTPQNRWDPAACHEGLALSEPNRLIAHYTARKSFSKWRTVLAVEPIPKEYFGIFYWEVKMLAKGGYVIGFATKPMPLGEHVGEHEGTYGYSNMGEFWGHEVEGCSHGYGGRPYIVGKPSFGVGDVVGCGVNLATRQIFYTKNGQRCDTANLFVSFAADLFPSVSSWDSGTKFEANFGPDFEYKL